MFFGLTFPNRWIGRDVPTTWPPRSPDINPLNFLLWRYVKDKVFSTPVADITNLEGKNNGPTPWPPRSPDITPQYDFFLWRYVKDKLFSTPVPDITNLEGRNNRRFCYSNWKHVGEHVERNWLSIRRSACNSRSTCWSVLVCCEKKTSWDTFWKNKVCIPHTVVFL